MSAQYSLTGHERQITENEVLISSTDLEGNVTFCNQELYAFTGYNPDEILGEKQKMLGAGGVPPSILSDIYASLKANKAYTAILKNRCRNGDHYWADVFFTPLYKEGKLSGIQSIRSKPDDACIARANHVYAKVLKSGSDSNANPTASGFRQRLGLFGKLAIVSSLILAVIFAALIYTLPHEGSLLITAFSFCYAANLLSLWQLTSRLRSFATRTKDIIDNDLATVIYTGRQDEVGQIELTTKTLQSKLKTAMGTVSSAVDDLEKSTAMSAKAVANTKNELNSQAGEIEHIVSAIEHMTSTIAEIARNTTEAATNANLTDSAVNAMNLYENLANQGVEQTQKSQRALTQISTQVSSIAKVNSRNAKATDQQSVATNEIASNVKFISKSAASTSEHADNNLKSSNEVLDLTRKLEGIVNSFSATVSS